MNRLQKIVVLLDLIENLQAKGSWCGETHIQKAAYFLQTLFKVPFGYEFVLYRYGPFSFDLSGELVRMKADGLLQSVPTPPFGVRFHPVDESNQLRSQFVRTRQSFEQAIGILTDEIGNKGVKELEKLATVQYIRLGNEEKLLFEEIAEKLTELKPHIGREEAEEAVIMFDSMKKRMTALY
ncbi:MAG TPA: hypothetical protein GX528_03325 [Firmicutes bacterium]|nr:hypothetical protein [Bacillota bacterium]